MAAGSSAPPRPTELLASFAEDRLRVVLVGASPSTRSISPGCPASPPSSRSTRRTAAARTTCGSSPVPPQTVQVAVTRYAAEHGLVVAENHLIRLGLEDVFLRLVDTKERAA